MRARATLSVSVSVVLSGPIAPRERSHAVTVDGVECRVNLKNRTVVCGSNLISNDERALFKAHR